MSEITKIAEQLNKRVAQLNNERSRQLGMQEAAKKQYEKAVELYESKYGVKLTPENLQQEYNKVYAELKTNMEVLKQTIEAIERGDYKESTVPNIDLEPEVDITIPEEPVVIKEEAKAQPKEEEVKPTIAQNKDEGVGGAKEVTFGGFNIDIPSFGGFNIGNEEVSKPKVEEAPTFAGLNFGEESPIEQPKIEITKEETPVFGGINFGSEEVTIQPKEEPKAEESNEFSGFDLSALIEDADNKPPVVNTPNTPKAQKSEKPKIPTDFAQPVPPKFNDFDEEDFEEEESFTPAGWGTPKSNTDINKSFADILNSQGISFGE